MNDQMLWDKLVSLDNLFLAFRKASCGKRAKACVTHYEFNLEENLFDLRDALVEGTYQHGIYQNFYIHDPKQRLISAANFHDRVVHHALVNVLEPIYEKRFIHDSYANRLGKGTHRALDRCSQFLRCYPYYLQLDIRQYFPSIDHQILLQLLMRKIDDPKVMALCALILKSGEKILNTEYEMTWFNGDTLLSACRPRGLPIGNMTSQFWANVYLDPLDQFIKRKLKCKAYIRYVDDMLLYSEAKASLHKWRNEIIDYLAYLRLSVHAQSAQVSPSWHGVTFLGFRLFPSYRRLKREKVLLAKKHLSTSLHELRIGLISAQTFKARLQGWINHAQYGDTWGLRKALLHQLGILVSDYV